MFSDVGEGVVVEIDQALVLDVLLLLNAVSPHVDLGIDVFNSSTQFLCARNLVLLIAGYQGMTCHSSWRLMQYGQLIGWSRRSYIPAGDRFLVDARNVPASQRMTIETKDGGRRRK